MNPEGPHTGWSAMASKAAPDEHESQKAREQETQRNVTCSGAESFPQTKQLCCGHVQPFCGTLRMYAHPIEVTRGHALHRTFVPAFSGGKNAGGIFLH